VAELLPDGVGPALVLAVAEAGMGVLLGVTLTAAVTLSDEVSLIVGVMLIVGETLAPVLRLAVGD
jgi:hypothetical protein